MGKRKQKQNQKEETPKVPRTIIISRGEKNVQVKRLKHDMRDVFLPNTGKKIKERKFNKTKDFLEVCGPLGVSHVMAFFLTDASLNLKLIKVPQGPTVSFKVVSYATVNNVQKSSGRPFDIKSASLSSPLAVMTNFEKSKHHELLVALLQNMFPPLKPDSLEIKNRKRVVLFDYDKDDDLIRFRHYLISTPVSGMNKALRNILYGQKTPDLGDVEKLSDYIAKSGVGSESEGEEADESRVRLAPGMTRSGEPTTRRVKLREIGPRMDLVLHKIEQGLMEGMVLYNKLVEKSMEEIAETARRREEQRELRTMRRKEQERRVELKRKQREEKKKAKHFVPKEKVSDDDDAEYYRQEVGADPDSHFGIERFPRETKKKNTVKRVRRSS